MKTAIAATVALMLGAGTMALTTSDAASAAAVVVKVGPGHHWHRAGHWMWHGRYWAHREWNCHRWHHRRVCTWRYW